MSNKDTILYITNVNMNKINGATEHINGFVAGAKKQNVDITLLSIDGIKILGKSLLFYSKLQQLIFMNIYSAFIVYKRRKETDLVYIRYSPFIILPIIISQLLKIKSAIELNGNIDRETLELFRPVMPVRLINSISLFIAFLLIDKVIVVTEGLKKYYLKYYPVSRGKIKVFSNAGVSGLTKRQKGLLRKGLYVSSEIIWSSFNEINQLKIHLEQRKILLEIMGEDKVSRKKFEGGNYDFGILMFNEIRLRLKGGFSPIKYFSYLSYGIPVITPDYSDINKITEDERVGLVYKRKSEIIQKILSLYQMKDYEEMSDRAYNLIQNKYNWKNNAKEILEWIKK
ncbi:MAG: hypothetical protein COX48_05575 [bacterium (Candidatus Stahlbacteria) CG23_combo_of_CG06-09_8_20_14_all_34_7]|nr:MAG: hypothetical protein COX48_05575 [bacterium (Candidatus Stahlbacteria) CG23_combo_of_CG06-09_8_20_14_all_34_7]